MQSKYTREPEDYKHSYTVGELLDYIEKHNIPREGKVLIQRVEDFYFEINHWHTVKRPECGHYMLIEKIEDIKANRKDYPKVTEEALEKMQKAVDDKIYYDEYVAVHSPVGHDEYKHLFLDAHY